MSDAGVIILDATECGELLAQTSMGRLAVDIAGRPEIFPVNYVALDSGLLFRSAPGTKLAGAVLMRHVAFEIDGYDQASRTLWSVVVKGWAREVVHPQERQAAEDLAKRAWVASEKPNLVWIETSAVTGRRFHVADDVEVDRSIGWSDA